MIHKIRIQTDTFVPRSEPVALRSVIIVWAFSRALQ